MTDEDRREEPRLDAQGAHPAPAPVPPDTSATSTAPFAAAAGATAAPAPAPAPAPVRRGRPFWQWWLIVSVGIAAVALVCLTTALGHIGGAPLHIVVDGDDVGANLNVVFGALPPAHQVALVSAVVLALVIVMFIVPLVVAIALAVGVLGLVAAIGLPLLAAGLALLIVFSPIWVIGGIIWFIARNQRRAAAARAAASATMHP